jgi:maleate isomerase
MNDSASASPSASRRQSRLGMLTPSSNTVLEPICYSMLGAAPDVSVHFARFRVTEISLTAAARGQFSRDGMLHAAELLADARVDAISWNGTSASWLGFDRDRDLCGAIKHATGVSATSSVLAMLDILRASGMTRLGLVSPYIDVVQRQIGETFAAEGFEIIDERHLGLSENFAFAAVAAPEVEDMIRGVAKAGPRAILVMCTNLRAAPLVERLERELGIPILDSIATAVWGALRLASVDTARLAGWGRLFRTSFPTTDRPAARIEGDGRAFAGLQGIRDAEKER